MFEYEEQPIEKESMGLPGGSAVEHFREIYVGAGSQRLICNPDGFSIGADTWANAPFKVTWAGAVTATSLTIVGGTIRAGQTAYNTGTGYWIGTDGATPKFSIGDGSTKYLTWDGSALTIRGTLNADDIVAGTLTGRTVQATDSATGANVKLDATNKRISFIYDNVEKGFMYVNSGGDVIIDGDNSVQIIADGAGDDVILSAGDDFTVLAGDNVGLSSNTFASFCTGNFFVESDGWSIFFNDDSGGDDCLWIDAGGGDDVLMRLDSGDESLYIDGVFIDTGADFAEFFEATSQFSGEKIKAGVSVVLVNDKIRPAQAGEVPFGVISAKPTIIGNSGGTSSDTQWGEKYLTDDFGNYIMEEVTFWSKVVLTKYKKNGKDRVKRERIKGIVERGDRPVPGAKLKKIQRKKINPLWDERRVYVPRSERPEWNVVGLIGRLRILKGQPVAPTWIKLREINPSVEEWLIK